jgi:carbohydrate diacid regulator
MRISKEIAEQIHDKAKEILGKDLVITDDKGVVVVGGRYGEFNLYAYQAISEGVSIQEKGDLYLNWSPLDYEGQVVGAFAIYGNHSEITEELIDLIRGLSQVLIYQGLFLENLYSLDRARAVFIRDLLVNGVVKSEDQANEQADILRINLRTNQAVILAFVSNYKEDYLDSLKKLSPEEKMMRFEEHVSETIKKLKQSFDGNDQNVVVYFSHNLFLILKGIRGDKVTTENSVKFFSAKGKYIYDTLTQITEHKVTVGVGQYYSNIKGLKKSFQDAKLALEIGSKIWGDGGVYHILDVGIFVSLSPISHQRKAELAIQLLKPLTDNEELSKTVEAFLGSGMNLTVAANKLHVHRNTLIYRLDKVKQVIGLDPRTFQGALQIKLGFMLSSLK